MGVEFGFRGLPGSISWGAPPAGVSSDGGVAARDGDTGVWGNGDPEAPKASEIPPWAVSDSKTDSTQNPMVFIASLFTSLPV